MEVSTLEATPDPERLVCRCARGDYYRGSVDVPFSELMENVTHNVDKHIDNGCSELEAKKRGLLDKLFDRGHYGPYEMPSITLDVDDVSIMTERQLTRHRVGWSFDVESGRYVDYTDEVEEMLQRLFAENATPSQDPDAALDIIDEYFHVPSVYFDGEVVSRQEGVVELSDPQRRKRSWAAGAVQRAERYLEEVEAGVPCEDARNVLGLDKRISLTATCNARSAMHLLDMRKPADAQAEIRELADEVERELADWMPYVFGEKYDVSPLAP